MGDLVPVAKYAKYLVLILFAIQLLAITIMTIFYALLFKDVKQCRTISLCLAAGCAVTSISAYMHLVYFKDVTGEKDPRLPQACLAMLSFFGCYAFVFVALCIFVLMGDTNACVVNMDVSSYEWVAICSKGMLINYIVQIIVGLLFCKTAKYVDGTTELKQY